MCALLLSKGNQNKAAAVVRSDFLHFRPTNRASVGSGAHLYQYKISQFPVENNQREVWMHIEVKRIGDQYVPPPETPRVTNTEVTFLDLSLKIGIDGRVRARTYEKPMNLHLNIPASSAHLPSVARGLIFGMLRQNTGSRMHAPPITFRLLLVLVPRRPSIRSTQKSQEASKEPTTQGWPAPLQSLLSIPGTVE